MTDKPKKGGTMKLCSFCGRDSRSNGPFITGDQTETTAYICAECVKACDEQFQELMQDEQSPHVLGPIPTPAELAAHLDLYVIGQQDAKRKMSVEVSNHYQRLVDFDQMRRRGSEGHSLIEDPDLQDVEIEKSNMLLVGPTGCGKTLLAQSLARKLNVPLAIGDATTLTEAGYVGEDVENLLLKLLIAADYDLELAQRGIIYIDEIDKIRSTGGNVSITRDVSGQGVQQSLLKMIEGTICNIPPQGGRKHPEQQYIQMDTKNILFIVGGAFVGLEEIIKRRTNKQSLGFGKPASIVDDRTAYNELMRSVRQDDLVEFGIIPELVGRLPVIATLEELSVDDLVRVLTEPKNALLKQEQKKLAYRGVKLLFTPEARQKIAELAIEKGTGARGLRSVLSLFMTDIQFDMPVDANGMTVVVDEDVVVGKRKIFHTAKNEAA